MATHSGDYRIAGTLTAGNWAQGRVTVTPVASTPTSTAVTGLSLQGSGSVHAWVTAHSHYPGSRVHEVSVSSFSASGTTIWIYRTDTTDTWVWWLMGRQQS